MKNLIFTLKTKISVFPILILLVFFSFYSCLGDGYVEPEIVCPDPTGQLGLVTLESGIVVEKKGNDYLIEGDIVLSPTQFKNLDKYGSLTTEEPKYIGTDTIFHPVYNIPMSFIAGDTAVPRAFSIYTGYNLWAMIRFTYNSNLTSQMKIKIKSALQEIESNTNVRFYNATGKNTVHPVYRFKYPYVDFISIGAGDTSTSRLGRVGGKQEISLANFAFTRSGNGVIIHEIGHALGLRHEQTRLDRNNYVTLNTSNLRYVGLAQFRIPRTNYHQTGTYDYNSVMGYSSYTSAISVVYNTRLPMYTKLDGSTIYQGSTFSSLDRKWANNIYIPYIARSDTYRELDSIVYKSDNTIMTASERLTYQAQLNNWNSTPPSGGRIPNDF